MLRAEFIIAMCLVWGGIAFFWYSVASRRKKLD